MAAVCCVLLPIGADAQVQAPASGLVTGTVVDAGSGLPLSNATLTASGAGATTQVSSDPGGHFRFAALRPGLYQIQASHAGYQDTLSDTVSVLDGHEAVVTLALAFLQQSSNTLRTIAVTTSHGSQALQRSSIAYRTVSPEATQRLGYFRAGDTLRTLPQVNSINGSDTAAPGDDLRLDVRGFGNLETTTLIDGHPVAPGVGGGGFNYEVSPTFIFRNFQVSYGSGGSDLAGVNAIGGTIDMQTLDPTVRPSSYMTQGWGTFNKLSTNLATTGSTANGRLGYAFALGTQGIDGPFNHARFFQPSAAFDPTAPHSSPWWQSGVYQDDTTAVNHAGLGKLRFNFGDLSNPTRLTVSALAARFWDDKTGNGDNDYLPYDTALAAGQANAANNSNAPAQGNINDPANCPGGTFSVGNAAGGYWGQDPQGNPDGGVPCMTPKQYAGFVTGYQGAGPAWQDFRLNDYHVNVGHTFGHSDVVLDGFTNRYSQTYDRTYSLPFAATYGDSAFWRNTDAHTSGASLTDDIAGSRNDFGFGYLWYNEAYQFQTNGKLNGAPVVHDNALFFRDVYSANDRLKLFAVGNAKHSTITNTSYFDPRFAAVYSPNANDAIRFSVGEASAQPWVTSIDQPFSPGSVGALNGNVKCGGGQYNAIGSGPDPALKPERASDVELGFGHRFNGDSIVQASLYNENLFDKIYGSDIPLAQISLNGIDPALISKFENAVASQCGITPSQAFSLLSLTTSVNLGHVLGQGFDVNGRYRFTRRFFVDYDYSTEVTKLISAPVRLLQNQVTLVPGGQLPDVPLHKATLSLDQTFGRDIEARLTGNYVGENNPKNMPGYAYADFDLGVPTSKDGLLNLAVTNVFGSHADYRGRIGQGAFLPENQYGSDVPGPLTRQELFGLPFTQLYLSYTIRLNH